jgi:hypothetical protein
MRWMAHGEEHRELMAAAVAHDGEGQRALLAGEPDAARAALGAAADLYRRSWEAAPPGGYGRLVGMLKSAVLAGGGEAQAAYVERALAGEGEGEGSPTACYARAIAALIRGDDARARQAAAVMDSGSEPFKRAAAAIVALADHDAPTYAAAAAAIVRDFEAREQHLTGVPIADTAVMLERLAERRGMSAGLESPLLPTARA